MCPPSTGGTPHRARVEEALRLWIVHVRSHSRHRQNVVMVMTLARVSMIVPLQNGHDVGRATSPEYESFMLWVISRESLAFWLILALLDSVRCSRLNSRHESAPLRSLGL